MPAIQVSRGEGRLIEVLARLVAPRRVVEVGALAGFSAIHLARALPPEGRLFTIENEPRHAEVAGRHLAAAGLADRATVILADGPQGLAQVAGEGPFDLVFVDADKARYDLYGRWARTNLRPGGLLLCDNAYLFGRLLDPHDPEAAAVRRLHEELDAWAFGACAPTPDGLLVGVKR